MKVCCQTGYRNVKWKDYVYTPERSSFCRVSRQLALILSYSSSISSCPLMVCNTRRARSSCWQLINQRGLSGRKMNPTNKIKLGIPARPSMYLKVKKKTFHIYTFSSFSSVLLTLLRNVNLRNVLPPSRPLTSVTPPK